jgi:uncharacterized protein (UPF0335 family)
VNTNADQRLQSIVERIVRLTEEKNALGDDIKEIMQEAKSAGYDIPALRIVVKRALETDEKRAKRQTAEEIAASMEAALGMLSDLPLGRSAIERAA